MRRCYGGSVDPWRGITALVMVAASVLVTVLFAIMATLVLHQDK